MKDHFTKLMPSLVAACLAMGVVSAQEDPSHPAHAQMETYNLRMSQAMALHGDQMAELASQYAAALERTAGTLQQQGNLDALLAVREEIGRFERTGMVPEQSPAKAHESVIKLQAIYNTSKAKADATKGQTTGELTQKYLTYLEGLQKKLTQDGKLDEAVKVRAEVERATKLQANMPAWTPPKENPTAPVFAATSLLFFWEQEHHLKVGIGRGINLKHEGGNGHAKDGSIQLMGGRTILEGLNDKLLEACKKSNALSLALHFETDSLKQTGPARIFSFSENGTLRNFSLCQENNQLVLRLRTTKTGDNGTNPEVKLGTIQQGKTHHVAVTYEPGKLSFYMDGKKVDVKQIGGDFSNWKKYQVVLGNEWKDDRAWKGTIRAFALHSSAIDEREALHYAR